MLHDAHYIYFLLFSFSFILIYQGSDSIYMNINSTNSLLFTIDISPNDASAIASSEIVLSFLSHTVLFRLRFL